MNSSHLSADTHTQVTLPLQQTLGIKLLLLLHHLLAFAPSLLIAWIYALAWRASILLGHWPRPKIDDPKFAIPADRLFDILYYPSSFVFVWFAVSLIVFPLLTVVLWRHNQWLRTLLLILVYVVGWLIGGILPNNAFTWFVD
jgi:hypothetical protein